MMVVLMVITTGVFVVLAASKVRSEETDGRAEPVLATAVSRPAWLAGHVLVTAVAAVVLLVLSGAGIGLAAAVGTRERSLLNESLVASLVYSPALLVIVGVATAGYGLHLRLLPIASALLAFSGFAALFGEMLQLPDWAMAISPWHHTATYPLEPVTAAPLLLQGLAALVLAALGIWAFGRRDLRSV